MWRVLTGALAQSVGRHTGSWETDHWLTLNHGGSWHCIWAHWCRDGWRRSIGRQSFGRDARRELRHWSLANFQSWECDECSLYLWTHSWRAGWRWSIWREAGRQLRLSSDWEGGATRTVTLIIRKISVEGMQRMLTSPWAHSWGAGLRRSICKAAGRELRL